MNESSSSGNPDKLPDKTPSRAKKKSADALEGKPSKKTVEPTKKVALSKTKQKAKEEVTSKEAEQKPPRKAAAVFFSAAFSKASSTLVSFREKITKKETSESDPPSDPSPPKPLKPSLDNPFRKPRPSGIRALLFDLYRKSPSWLVSVVVHALLIFLMALYTLPILSPQSNVIDVSAFESLDIDDQDVDFEIDADDLLEESSEFETELISNVPEASVFLNDDLDAAVGAVEVSDFGIELASSDLTSDIAGSFGEGLDGRGTARASLTARHGGNAKSEKAVTDALRWLANHQRQDGSWSFDHTKGHHCNGQCGNPGSLRAAYSGATGLALLPFLGAGNTQTKGPYTAVVGNGLNALVGMIKRTPNGGSLTDTGRMYSHGIATMALCEAYGMTRQRALKEPANAALRFIVTAQDPKGGGWRYYPRDPGDTSVTGWQILALKSGHLSSLDVPAATLDKARFFLDSVQLEGGARYTYLAGSPRPKSVPKISPIGLLCRMHMGWTPDNPVLTRGIAMIAQQGPSASDAYYNYYATQAMFQYTGGTGRIWKAWNVGMRDFLIKTQVQKGSEAGSWFVLDEAHVRKSKEGGRLYYTVLCCMTLEIYYRHRPIYKRRSVTGSF